MKTDPIKREKALEQYDTLLAVDGFVSDDEKGAEVFTRRLCTKDARAFLSAQPDLGDWKDASKIIAANSVWTKHSFTFDYPHPVNECEDIRTLLDCTLVPPELSEAAWCIADGLPGDMPIFDIKDYRDALILCAIGECLRSRCESNYGNVLIVFPAFERATGLTMSRFVLNSFAIYEDEKHISDCLPLDRMTMFREYDDVIKRKSKQPETEEAVRMSGFMNAARELAGGFSNVYKQLLPMSYYERYIKEGFENDD